MKAYLHVFGLWEAMEEDEEPEPLLENPAKAQIKAYSEATTKRYKSLTCIHATVSEEI